MPPTHGKIRKNTVKIIFVYFWGHFLDFLLFGSWEALDCSKILTQVPPTISTPGEAIPRLFLEKSIIGRPKRLFLRIFSTKTVFWVPEAKKQYFWPLGPKIYFFGPWEAKNTVFWPLGPKIQFFLSRKYAFWSKKNIDFPEMTAAGPPWGGQQEGNRNREVPTRLMTPRGRRI